ncbi:hydroxyisourate hydrolase [Planomonospora parontospora]|uniref:hydroxyisourate hydrolase n=1 Tax=Planomonospora parontospora TaxID=58119 RepID=UPI00167070DD|nr:hydroxyisourate hydrolase [Planomonospora parontospora]GGL04656.1 5-hydroxyisourate hydrolase [Planomonospora parontospora subsp. antibiotica]GII13519.1 5-hydroxyisourate hydrolase [Planomonospora parontospora subsp. antibiotica]
MSLSTHVLDAAVGRPAEGVAVRLLADDGTPVAEGSTDADGRIEGWRPGPGVHRLVFDTGAYFAARGTDSFYPEVCVAFRVGDPDEHYHVPLLLSPFAYSTYRGS